MADIDSKIVLKQKDTALSDFEIPVEVVEVLH